MSSRRRPTRAQWERRRAPTKSQQSHNNRQRGGRSTIPRNMIQAAPERYVDTTVSGSITGVGSLNQISDVPQGVGQGQRTGDRIYMKHFIWNYTVYQFNADVVNTVRLMVVQFIPSTALLSTAITDFLQTASPYSLYSHENRAMYRVLYDQSYRVAGTSTVPTARSAIGRTNVKITPRIKKTDFALASTTGATNQCFVLLVGDSTVTPFAQIESTVRMVYRNGD